MKEGQALARFIRRRALDGEPHKTRQLLAALALRRKSCSMTHIERDHPFSWFRCFASLVSYGLVLSDVLRTGPALRNVPKALYPLEPDSVASFEPVGYPVNYLTSDNATDQASERYWPYKYDTTSVGVRALVQHFQLQSWSPCLLYQERCDETQGLPLSKLFTAIDSVIGAASGSGSVTLRVDSLFRDNLHHYAMPWFYEVTIKRTSQATYYVWHTAQSVRTILCDPRKATRPYLCGETWASRLEQSCAQSGQECRNARRISEQILQRVRALSQLYPNETIESVIIDSTDDYGHEGMILPGHRGADVVALSRVRSCLDGTCTTVAVDDYRFETTMLTMNVAQWFSVVALLRVVGQAYTWLRVFLLIWICHVSRRNTSHEYRKSSRLSQFRTVIRTIFLVPSQVVVYGSLLPISLYYLAHLIDSPATYGLVAINFDSLLGSATWNVADIAHHCAVSMRSVWVLSFYCHVVQAAWTRCVWSPSFGIPGISEYLITLMASFTLLAPYRVLTLRNTSVLRVFEVISSARMHQLRSQPQDMTRTTLTNLLFGSTMDWKCLVHAAIVIAAVCAVVLGLNRALPRWFPFHVSMVSRSIVPHSASHLWPRNRLVVSWFSALITRTSGESKVQDSRRLTLAEPEALLPPAQQTSSVTARPSTQRFSLQAHQEPLTLTNRSRETESAIYLMNFAAMTDPCTLLQLRFFSGRQVATYQSKTTQQCFLLPYDERTSSADSGIDWEDLRLLAVTNTKDLEWDDLLRCG